MVIKVHRVMQARAPQGPLALKVPQVKKDPLEVEDLQVLLDFKVLSVKKEQQEVWALPEIEVLMVMWGKKGLQAPKAQ